MNCSQEKPARNAGLQAARSTASQLAEPPGASGTEGAGCPVPAREAPAQREAAGTPAAKDGRLVDLADGIHAKEAAGQLEAGASVESPFESTPGAETATAGDTAVPATGGLPDWPQHTPTHRFFAARMLIRNLGRPRAPQGQGPPRSRMREVHEAHTTFLNHFTAAQALRTLPD